jgi:hypothetical protein
MPRVLSSTSSPASQRGSFFPRGAYAISASRYALMMLPEGRTAAAPSSRRCAAFVSAVAVIGWRHDLVTLLRTATLPVKPLSGSNGRSPAAALAKPQFYRRYCLIPGVREEGKKWAQSIAVLRPFAYVREWRSPNTPRYPGNARASGREVLLLPGAFLCPGPAAPHPAQTKKRPFTFAGQHVRIGAAAGRFWI